MVSEKRSSTSIQSVTRASRILLAVADEPAGLAAQQISDRFELTLSTAYHLLSTLADEGLLAKVEGRRYVLGPAAGVIANSVARELRPDPVHLTALQELATTTSETAFLTGWHLGKLRIEANVEGAHAVRVSGLEVGFTESIHARAASKLLLAYADSRVREEVLHGYAFTPYTDNTIVSRAAFDEELAQIRREGLGRDREEFREGVYSLSAPIWQGDKVIAALAVSAPSQRFASNEDDLVASIRRIAAAAGTGR